MNTKEIHASIFLNALSDLGPVRFQALIKKYGTAGQAMSVGIDDWGDGAFFGQETIKHLKQQKDEANSRADEDLKLIDQYSIRIYLAHAGPYPPLLKEVKNAPPIIYAMGEEMVDVTLPHPVPAVAIVGSRRCSYYGEKMAAKLSAELVEAGAIVVSGLARGIDTHAHAAALKAGGKTWAVIGSGLSVLYPPENRELAMKIKDSGAIISEFPMKTTPFPSNFPRRNRIIAGLTLGTVVVEGSETSGALITARLAAEEGRDVFAVPGPATSLLSAAPHRLLKMGAKMVESAADIIEEFAQVGQDKLLTAFSESQKPNLTDTQQAILSLLGEEAMPREILIDRLGMESHITPALFLEMELRGLIKSLPGGMITRK